jgi:hypothetical protein
MPFSNESSSPESGTASDNVQCCQGLLFTSAVCHIKVATVLYQNSILDRVLRQVQGQKAGAPEKELTAPATS